MIRTSEPKPSGVTSQDAGTQNEESHERRRSAPL